MSSWKKVKNSGGYKLKLNKIREKCFQRARELDKELKEKAASSRRQIPVPTITNHHQIIVNNQYILMQPTTSIASAGNIYNSTSGLGIYLLSFVVLFLWMSNV